MIYIFDTSPLIHLFNHYDKNLFPSLWKNFDSLIEEGKITSVREVYNEITEQDDELTKWAKDNQHLFPEPTINEQTFLSTFFENSTHRTIIDRKIQLKGGKCADPFIIAKGKTLNDTATVVTADGFSSKGKINSNFYNKTGELYDSANKLAHICTKQKIPCICLMDFMKKENWSF